MDNSNNEDNDININSSTDSLSMEQLPEQVVSEVFQYLDTQDLNQMAQTSHDWKLMTENNTLLRHIHCLKIENKNIEANHNVTRGIKYCDKVILNKCTMTSKKFGQIMKEIGGKLTSIQMLDSFITDNKSGLIFKYIADYCPMVESIEFISTKEENFELFKEADLEPLLACPNIHTIKIHGVAHKDFKIMGPLIKNVWRFEYTYVTRIHSKYHMNMDPIVYCPRRNAIYYESHNYQLSNYQLFPTPKDGSNGVTNYVPETKFYNFDGSFKANTYEVIDVNEQDYTITIMKDNGITEEYKPTEQFFKEIIEHNKQNNECFISLIHIHQKNKVAPYDELNGTIENGFVDRPPYWN